MATACFVVLHLVALLVFPAALFVTIPAHIIYAVLAKKAPASSNSAHVSCPTCRESVHPEALRCRHCGQALVPESVQVARRQAERRAIQAGKPWYSRWLY